VFVKERSAPRVDRVDFNVSVGTRVPRSVHFVPVPRSIVEIEPSWRGYDYFMIGDQIIIVDPRSMEIVAVIDNRCVSCFRLGTISADGNKIATHAHPLFTQSPQQAAPGPPFF
jgi:Protein of unknown function (DUF1236)